MAAPGANLTRKQEDAIIAFLSNPRIEDAARVANVGARTLMRWLKEPVFEKAYMKARRTAFRHSLARLQQMSGAAVSTLGKIMVDQASPAPTRVRAAECIINQGAKAIEIEDIDVRVSELERAAEITKSSGK
jgi:hypothetical protein